jgi:hypothetical protein
MRVRYLLAACVLAVGVVAVVASGSSSVSNKPAQQTGSTATGASPAKAPASVAHVGSAITVSTGNTKADVTLLAVTDPAQGADQYTNPDSGKRFVATQVKIANGGTGTLLEDANNDLSIIGSDNQTYTPAFDNLAGCTNFNNGSYTLAAGETTTGCVAFQVPTGVTTSKVRFELVGFGGVQGEWLVP